MGKKERTRLRDFADLTNVLLFCQQCQNRHAFHHGREVLGQRPRVNFLPGAVRNRVHFRDRHNQKLLRRGSKFFSGKRGPYGRHVHGVSKLASTFSALLRSENHDCHGESGDTKPCPAAGTRSRSTPAGSSPSWTRRALRMSALRARTTAASVGTRCSMVRSLIAPMVSVTAMSSITTLDRPLNVSRARIPARFCL